ncbi:MAG: LytTR family DNA-binding domain-containing protein [Bacteroidales bacterium]|jgi:DNA-binding LytR/AlgR family response regulator|nr:LytTR family DNA-binding domain-containing protein [Bacteroidales bacterium]
MKTCTTYMPTERGKMGIDTKYIIYVEAARDFSRVILNNNESLNLLLTIDEVEQLLYDQGFFRFNYKHLVNLRYVQMIFTRDASKVILENEKEIFVSQSRREALFENLKKVFDLQEVAG